MSLALFVTLGFLLELAAVFLVLAWAATERKVRQLRRNREAWTVERIVRP